MPFSEEDKIIIKHYRIDKNYGVKRLSSKFPNKGWTKGGLRHLLTKIDKTGDVKRVPGSGRPRTAVTEEIAEEVEEMICSQEEFPGTHKSQRKIS